MDNHNITVDRLNLVAIVCIILAAKIEDCDVLIPKMSEIPSFVNVTYAAQDFAVVERMILKFFNFELNTPTAATFLEMYIEAAISQDDVDANCDVAVSSTNGQVSYTSVADIKSKLSIEVFTFLNLSLSNTKLSSYRPSLLAAAILAAARNWLKSELDLSLWPLTMRQLTYYSVDEVRALMVDLTQVRSAQRQPTSNEKRKNTPESGYISDPHDSDSDSSDDETANEAKKPCI